MTGESWRLRVLGRLARLAARLPLGRLLRSDTVRAWKLRAGRQATGPVVVEIVRLLDTAAVEHWVAGGWGVDALAGRQTRPHHDLDVVVDAAVHGSPDAVAAALAPRGLRLAATETSIEPMPLVWVFSDGAGVTVEVLPVDRGRPPFDRADAFTTGAIAGTQVRCVSAATQRALRTGYEIRPEDLADLALLDGLESP